MTASISPYPKTRHDVLGLAMACIDEGAGNVYLFLHGNPTSSFLWRDCISRVLPTGRCVAPDLIGMGDSDKLPSSGPDRYSFTEHRRYLDALIATLLPDEKLTLVLHDWGTALGFDWARRNPQRVAGIVHMEGIVMPIEWKHWPRAATGIFQGFRSPAGEKMVLEQNLFVEAVLPTSIMRTLTDAEMNEYRRPFANPGEDRRPTLSWPRQIPLDGEPAEVVKIVSDYSEWLAGSPIPKLFVNADPGAILRGEQREFCRSWPAQQEVTVPGIHFIQEDSGPEIGDAIVAWAESAAIWS